MINIKNHIKYRVLEHLPSLSTIDQINLGVHFSNGDISARLPIHNISEKDVTSILKIKPDHVFHNIALAHNYSNENFLLFSLNKTEFIKEILNGTRNTLSPVREKPKKILIEYSSPNIAKPFHMGHLRSTVTGHFTANILERQNNVVRINYLGDWGTQFGFVKAGLDKMNIDLSKLCENPLKKINEAYVLANQDKSIKTVAQELSSSFERNENEDILKVWKEIRRITYKHLEETYRMLGIQFDEYAWESEYVKNFESMLEDLKRCCLTEDMNGQLLISRNGKSYALTKSDGTSLYLSRDIAAALDRYSKYKCDSIKYVVDKSQEEHIATLRHVVSKLLEKDIVEHIKFGKVLGMSTRDGTGVFLSDILDKATEIMIKQQQNSPNTRDRSKEVSQTLAISTLIIYILRNRREKDFKFSWDTALQSTGDSGVKLQYTHSRLGSLEKNTGVCLPETCLTSHLKEPMVLDIVYQISKYDDILNDCEKDLEPSYLVNYLFKLCNTVSRCLKQLPVKGETKEVAEQRILLFHTTRLIINHSIKLLGLSPLDQM